MGLWKDFLRLLGLTSDARVHISAPGIDVVITGEPDQVRALLSVVKYELERSTRWRDRDPKRGAIAGGSERTPRDGSKARSKGSGNYVQPTELDEMDSPYALPEPLVMPVDEITDERARQPASRKASEAPPRAYASEPATLVPDVYEPKEPKAEPPDLKQKRIDARPKLVRTESPPEEVSSTKIDSKPPPQIITENDEPEREVTAVSPNPSGPQPAQSAHATTPPTGPGPSSASPAIVRSSNNPFHTDGGPTLTGSVDDSDIHAVTPAIRKDLRGTDLELDDTKETNRKSS